MIYGFQWLVHITIRLYLRVRGVQLVVQGEQYISSLDSTKPILLVSNHRHAFDAFAIGAALPYTRSLFPAHFLATRQFKTRLLAFGTSIGVVPLVYRLGGVITIERGIGIEQSLKKPLQVLIGHNTIIMFPEGTRNMGDEPLLPIRDGAAYLATHARAQVLPMYITYKKHAITLTIGEPFYIITDNLKEGSEIIRAHLLTLAST